MSVQTTIEQTVKSNPVVLFMKGTKDFPQCGFSAKVVQILRESGIEFLDINVLEDPEVREGIKVYSNWPTIPQLYIKGEFIGGCDIVTELYESDQLPSLISN